MVAFNHKSRTKVFKGLVAVIYLAFFTTQLSFKFHVCANFPITQLIKTTSASANVQDDVPNVDRALILSVDKRYDHETTFALVTPLFKIKADNVPDLHDTTVRQTHHKSAIIFLHSLRGPPVA